MKVPEQKHTTQEHKEDEHFTLAAVPEHKQHLQHPTASRPKQKKRPGKRRTYNPETHSYEPLSVPCIKADQSAPSTKEEEQSEETAAPVTAPAGGEDEAPARPKKTVAASKMGFGKIDFGAVKLRSNRKKPAPREDPAPSETAATAAVVADAQEAAPPTTPETKPKRTYGFGGVQQFAPRVPEAAPGRRGRVPLSRTQSTPQMATGAGAPLRRSAGAASDSEKINQLLLWVKARTAGYANVQVTNFTTSFKDGLAFCALVDRARPGLIDVAALDPRDAERNLRLAFDTAERLGVPRLLEEQDIVRLPVPERLSIITYVLELRKVLH